MNFPHEIVSLVLNGADQNGSPFLDARHRFLAKHVCCQWYECVSNPSSPDAVRMCVEGTPYDGAAWVRGRLACVSLVVETVASAGMTPADAVARWTTFAPRDSSAEYIVAAVGVATADANVVADAFDRVVDSLASTASQPRDWFHNAPVHRHVRTVPKSQLHCGIVDSLDMHTRRDLLRCACRTGRAETVYRLLDRFDVGRRDDDDDAFIACLREAVARDHADVVSVLLQHSQRRCRRKAYHVTIALNVAATVGASRVLARFLVVVDESSEFARCAYYDAGAHADVHRTAPQRPRNPHGRTSWAPMLPSDSLPTRRYSACPSILCGCSPPPLRTDAPTWPTRLSITM